VEGMDRETKNETKEGNRYGGDWSEVWSRRSGFDAGMS